MAFASVARAACALPDDGSGNPSDCPLFDWSETSDGVLTIADHGEALWVDAAGVLHVADNPRDVPEPFRSMYAARHNDHGRLTFADATARFVLGNNEVADDASPRATARLMQQQQWRDDMATWRLDLYTSTRALLEAVLHPPSAGFNPLAFALPPSRVLAQTNQRNAAETARGRVLHARHMLLDVLPQHAREDGVPGFWLR